jgi:hypothetical protein
MEFHSMQLVQNTEVFKARHDKICNSLVAVAEFTTKAPQLEAATAG